MEGRERISSYEIRIRLGIVFAFICMWYICHFVTHSDCFFEVEPIWVELFGNRNILLIGLILFLIPYEYIISLMSEAVLTIMKIFRPTSEIAKKSETEKIAPFCVLGIYIAIMIYSENNSFTWKIYCVDYYCTMLAIIMMYMAYDNLSNKWLRYAISCVAVSTINAAVCYEYTLGFISSAFMYFLLLVSWHLYDTMANKKIEWKMITASIIYTIMLFFAEVCRTGHYTRLLEYLNPHEAFGNYTCLKMVFLRNQSIIYGWTGDGAEAWRHPFIGMSEMFGPWMLVIFFILLLYAGYGVFRQFIISINKNVKRSCMFLTVFLWYVFAVIYCFICDMGYLPECSVSFTGLKFTVLILVFMFRVLYEGKSYEEKEWGDTEETEDDEFYEDCEIKDSNEKNNTVESVENVETQETKRERDMLSEIYNRQETLFRAMIGINTRIINVEEALRNHLEKDEDSV